MIGLYNTHWVSMASPKSRYHELKSLDSHFRSRVWQGGEKKKGDPGRYEFTMSPHVGHGRTQFNFQVSRDMTGNLFFIASSPRRKALSGLGFSLLSRLLYTQNLSILSTLLSRVRTPLLAGFSRAYIVLFP